MCDQSLNRHAATWNIFVELILVPSHDEETLHANVTMPQTIVVCDPEKLIFKVRWRSPLTWHQNSPTELSYNYDGHLGGISPP